MRHEGASAQAHHSAAESQGHSANLTPSRCVNCSAGSYLGSPMPNASLLDVVGRRRALCVVETEHRGNTSGSLGSDSVYGHQVASHSTGHKRHVADAAHSTGHKRHVADATHRSCYKLCPERGA